MFRPPQMRSWKTGLNSKGYNMRELRCGWFALGDCAEAAEFFVAFPQTFGGGECLNFGEIFEKRGFERLRHRGQIIVRATQWFRHDVVDEAEFEKMLRSN